MARVRLIAIAGNIGVGKTSLVRWLHHTFGFTPFFEPHDENPYLADFYGDMSRWAVHSQLFFLVRRFRIHKMIEKQARRASKPIVQDRTLYEDAEIFARYLHRTKKMSQRDFEMYWDLYETLRDTLRPPELMIYLRCPVSILTKRIRKRGRDYEQSLPRSYLAGLEKLYDEWYGNYELGPKLTIATDRIDYVEHMFDRLEVVRTVERALASHKLT